MLLPVQFIVYDYTKKFSVACFINSMTINGKFMYILIGKYNEMGLFNIQREFIDHQPLRNST